MGHPPTPRLGAELPGQDGCVEAVRTLVRQTVVNETTQGNERGAYITLDTSVSQGMRDRLRGASPMATEPP